MLHRAPQRSYTPRSIEAWFNRLNQDWERFFSREELQWGRAYYRTGEIRSTELLDDSAIVHFKRGKEPLYVIVDWNDSRPSFRFSHPEFAPGDGLAVAGMYGLEEFVGDELPPVLEETGPAQNGEAGSGSGNREPEVPTRRDGRTLCIQLQARPDGLWLEAGWKDSRTAAERTRFTLKDLTRWEREQLIGYAARAHRSGFKPGDREGTYRLGDAARIGTFLSRDLPEWSGRYAVQEDPGVAAWKKGLQDVRPVIRLREEGRQSRYRFDFEIGNRPVTGDIRLRLLRQPGHPQFVPGKGLFQVDPKALEAVHEWRHFLPAEGEGTFPRYLLFHFAREAHIRLDLSREIAAWRAQLDQASEAVPDEDLPGWLRPYQKSGVGWIRRLAALDCHGLLADEMGLGKTVQVLACLQEQGILGREPVLVVCPASVVPVWLAEVERFFPSTPVRVLSRREPLAADPPALWITSYTQLRRNKHQLAGLEFAYTVLDEAQSIKNPDAKVTHACLAIQSRHRIALTGTPVENRPLDLWTLFRFLMPGFLGTRRHFEERARTDPGFVGELRRQASPFILRRTKNAVASDLPPKVEIDWTCPLSPTQRALYRSLAEGGLQAFEGPLAAALQQRRMHLFSLLTRLRQACCDPALVPGEEHAWRHSGKLVSLTNRLGEPLAAGSKVVVFSQFVQFLRRARKAVMEMYPEIPQLELTGATLDRAKPVSRFVEMEGGAVFFISLRAGGTGLNLQAADYVFLLDPWWNPAVEAQAIDRVHRLGQRKRVLVYRMLTRGTIEERIQRLKAEKGRLFEDLLSDLDVPGDLFEQFGSLEELVALGEPDSLED